MIPHGRFTDMPKGWAGAPVTPCPLPMPYPDVEDMCSLLEHEQKLRLERALEEIRNRMQSVKTPFVTMSSPNGSPLSFIEEESCDWLLMTSLVLDVHGVPESKFKVMGKNKRLMIVTLEDDGSLCLKRDDQPNREFQYNMKWVSDDVRNLWSLLREQLVVLCNSNPGEADRIQLSFLQMLLADAKLPKTLKEKVQQYCYSTNAWLSMDSIETMEGVWDKPEYMCNSFENPSRRRWDDDLDDEGHSARVETIKDRVGERLRWSDCDDFDFDFKLGSWFPIRHTD